MPAVLLAESTSLIVHRDPWAARFEKCKNPHGVLRMIDQNLWVLKRQQKICGMTLMVFVMRGNNPKHAYRKYVVWK